MPRKPRPNIAAGLKPLERPIEGLIPHATNARLHDEDNLATIQASLRLIGQVKPLVVTPAGVVLVGNGTLEAAKRLGWTSIAAAVVEVEGHEAELLAITDNRTQEQSRFGAEPLAKVLLRLEAQGVNLAAMGFKDYEVGPLRLAVWEHPPAPEKVEREDAMTFTVRPVDAATIRAAHARAGGGVAGALAVADWYVEEGSTDE